MTTLLEASRLALEALEYPLNQSHENFNVDMAELISHRAITALRQAIEQAQNYPPECQTEAEKTAFAFGWWKALETNRIEQAQKQEPVAIVIEVNKVGAVALRMSTEVTVGTRLYTSPPQRQPMTAMEVYDAVHEADLDWHTGFALGEDENRFVVFARAIEAAHGIKGEA